VILNQVKARRNGEQDNLNAPKVSVVLKTMMSA